MAASDRVDYRQPEAGSPVSRERLGSRRQNRCPGLGLGPAHGEGSGVIIDDEGIVLTNAHVVQQAPTVDLLFTDGRDPVEGEVVGTVPERDLAVVWIQEDGSGDP